MRRPLLVLTIAVLAFGLSGCSGPVGPFSGGALGGEEHKGSVSDWGFAAEVETVQLETNPAEPYSVNTWIGVIQGQAYIPTSLIMGAENPQEREWVQNITANADARLRIERTIYNVRLQRVKDQGELELARNTLLTKYAESATEHSSAAWIYRVISR